MLWNSSRDETHIPGSLYFSFEQFGAILGEILADFASLSEGILARSELIVSAICDRIRPTGS